MATTTTTTSYFKSSQSTLPTNCCPPAINTTAWNFLFLVKMLIGDSLAFVSLSFHPFCLFVPLVLSLFLLSLSECLSLSLSLSLSLRHSFFLSLSICLSVSLSQYLSLCLPLYCLSVPLCLLDFSISFSHSPISILSQSFSVFVAFSLIFSPSSPFWGHGRWSSSLFSLFSLFFFSFLLAHARPRCLLRIRFTLI